METAGSTFHDHGIVGAPLGGVVLEMTLKIPCISIESALNFIPYGCLVDEFQHEVYENPKLTPQERKNYG